MKTKIKMKFPKGATHVRLTTKDGKHTIVTKKNLDTLEGVEGSIEFGRQPKGKSFEVIEAPASKVPRGGLYAESKTANGRATKPGKPKAARKSKAKKGNGEVGKCEFIDALYLEGGYTKKEIFEKAMKQFPSEPEKKMWSNVRVRPHHIRKAGKTPKWVTPKKAKAIAA